MGGLCSKEGVAEAPPGAPAPAPLQKAPSQSLKQLITLAAKDEDAAPAVMSRTASNAKATAIAPAPAEKTAPAVVVITSLSKSYSTAGAPTHHRRATAREHDPGEQVGSEVVRQPPVQMRCSLLSYCSKIGRNHPAFGSSRY